MRVIRKMVDDDVQLTVLRENPKGGKSRDRYEAYKVATSAAEFQRLGGSAEDLRNDLVRGYVTLGGEAAKDPCVLAALLPATGAAAPRPRGEARAVARPELAPRPTTASDGAFQSCLRDQGPGAAAGHIVGARRLGPAAGPRHVSATRPAGCRSARRTGGSRAISAAARQRSAAFAGRWLDIVDDRAKVLVERSGPRACGALVSFRAHVLEGLGDANLDAAGRADVDARARLIQGHIDENWAKARRLDDLATRIAAARLAADDGGGAGADRRGDGGGDGRRRDGAATATAASTPPTLSSFGSTICRGSGTSWRPAESR
ncbi:potassium:proton antiporter [Aureococcus anophagefferens]|nr:potassium:proton antiporter [Aureococcus anophagefferens]